MSTMQFISVHIGDYLFGINVDYVREVNRLSEITPIALAPEFISGLVNLRGQIITIYDPGIKLGFGKRDQNSSSRFIVLKTFVNTSLSSGVYSNTDNIDLIGLLVDGIGDILTINTEFIEELPAHISDVKRTYLHGVVKLEESLLILLKIKDLITEAVIV